MEVNVRQVRSFFLSEECPLLLHVCPGVTCSIRLTALAHWQFAKRVVPRRSKPVGDRYPPRSDERRPCRGVTRAIPMWWMLHNLLLLSPSCPYHCDDSRVGSGGVRRHSKRSHI